MSRFHKTAGYFKRNLYQIVALVSFLILYVASPYISQLQPYQASISVILLILVYIFSGWIISRIVNYSFARALKRRFNIDKADNLYERQMQTKLRYIKATVNVVIWILVLALIFSMFDRLKTIGSSLLVSAGIASVILGFAAQKSIGNLIAGFQIAFTQPIRIDDAVLVEGEWGWIEEITLTYVVVRIWDKRRLVLPISYFVTTPFQNWTKESADILGTVFLYTDYTVPIDALREELDRILNTTGLWDGKVSLIQMTDTTEKTVELRVLVSARNSPDAWDLRCLVREKMVEYIKHHYPDALPVTRALFKEKK
ncbi:MAG: mechanosensitive ion channel family protein [Nanoarchaeota archaeon]